MFSFEPSIYWVLPYVIECGILYYIHENLMKRKDAADYPIRAKILKFGIVATGLLALYNLIGPYM